MLKSIQELIELKFSGNNKERRLAVVCADSEHTMEGVIRAYHEKLVRPILIGDSSRIKAILHGLNCHDDMEFVEAPTKEEALRIMVDMVHANECNAVMKGNMDTKDILGAILKKENNLTERGVLNSITFSEIPTYHKMLMIGDPGMIIAPTLDQKVGIIHNCLRALRGLGYTRPKVAVLSCVEKINPKIEATVHAGALMDMADAGVFGECDLYGPLSYDLIVNKEAAEIKGVDSPVCGDADLVLVPDLNCGNTLTKCLSYSARAVGGGITLGAKVPVLVPSRASSARGKYMAIVLGCAIDYCKEGGQE